MDPITKTSYLEAEVEEMRRKFLELEASLKSDESTSEGPQSPPIQPLHSRVYYNSSAYVNRESKDVDPGTSFRNVPYMVYEQETNTKWTCYSQPPGAFPQFYEGSSFQAPVSIQRNQFKKRRGPSGSRFYQKDQVSYSSAYEHQQPGNMNGCTSFRKAPFRTYQGGRGAKSPGYSQAPGASRQFNEQSTSQKSRPNPRSTFQRRGHSVPQFSQRDRFYSGSKNQNKKPNGEYGNEEKFTCHKCFNSGSTKRTDNHDDEEKNKEKFSCQTCLNSGSKNGNDNNGDEKINKEKFANQNSSARDDESWNYNALLILGARLAISLGRRYYNL